MIHEEKSKREKVREKVERSLEAEANPVRPKITGAAELAWRAQIYGQSNHNTNSTRRTLNPACVKHLLTCSGSLLGWKKLLHPPK